MCEVVRRWRRVVRRVIRGNDAVRGMYCLLKMCRLGDLEKLASELGAWTVARVEKSRFWWVFKERRVYRVVQACTVHPGTPPRAPTV